MAQPTLPASAMMGIVRGLLGANQMELDPDTSGFQASEADRVAAGLHQLAGLYLLEAQYGTNQEPQGSSSSSCGSGSPSSSKKNAKASKASAAENLTVAAMLQAQETDCPVGVLLNVGFRNGSMGALQPAGVMTNPLSECGRNTMVLMPGDLVNVTVETPEGPGECPFLIVGIGQKSSTRGEGDLIGVWGYDAHTMLEEHGQARGTGHTFWVASKGSGFGNSHGARKKSPKTHSTKAPRTSAARGGPAIEYERIAEGDVNALLGQWSSSGASQQASHARYVLFGTHLNTVSAANVCGLETLRHQSTVGEGGGGGKPPVVYLGTMHFAKRPVEGKGGREGHAIVMVPARVPPECVLQTRLGNLRCWPDGVFSCAALLRSQIGKGLRAMARVPLKSKTSACHWLTLEPFNLRNLALLSLPQSEHDPTEAAISCTELHGGTAWKATVAEASCMDHVLGKHWNIVHINDEHGSNKLRIVGFAPITVSCIPTTGTGKITFDSIMVLGSLGQLPQPADDRSLVDDALRQGMLGPCLVVAGRAPPDATVHGGSEAASKSSGSSTVRTSTETANSETPGNLTSSSLSGSQAGTESSGSASEPAAVAVSTAAGNVLSSFPQASTLGAAEPGAVQGLGVPTLTHSKTVTRSTSSVASHETLSEGGVSADQGTGTGDSGSLRWETASSLEGSSDLPSDDGSAGLHCGTKACAATPQAGEGLLPLPGTSLLSTPSRDAQGSSHTRVGGQQQVASGLQNIALRVEESHLETPPGSAGVPRATPDRGQECASDAGKQTPPTVQARQLHVLPKVKASKEGGGNTDDAQQAMVEGKSSTRGGGGNTNVAQQQMNRRKSASSSEKGQKAARSQKPTGTAKMQQGAGVAVAAMGRSPGVHVPPGAHHAIGGGYHAMDDHHQTAAMLAASSRNHQLWMHTAATATQQQQHYMNHVGQFGHPSPQMLSWQMGAFD